MKLETFQNRIFITIIIVILFYVLFALYSDITKLGENYVKIKLSYISPIFGTLIFSIFIRSLLQRYLLMKIGIDLSIKQSFILFWAGLSMLFTPFGSGQMIKSHFLKSKYGHDISKSLPLVFAERFFDLIALFVIVTASLFLFYSPETLLVSFVSLIFLSIFLIAVKSTKAMIVIKSITNKISFLSKTFEQTSQLDSSLRQLFKIKVVANSCLLSMFAFSLEGFVVYLAFLTFGIDIGYMKTIQIFYTSVLSGTLSFIPAGTGVLEAAFVKLMIKQNFDLSEASSLIIFIRITTTWFATISGFLLSFVIMKNNESNQNKIC